MDRAWPSVMVEFHNGTMVEITQILKSIRQVVIHTVGIGGGLTSMG